MNVYDRFFTPPVVEQPDDDDRVELLMYDAGLVWQKTKSVNAVGRHMYHHTTDTEMVTILAEIVSMDDLFNTLVECICHKHRDDIARFNEYRDRLTTAYEHRLTDYNTMSQRVSRSIVNWFMPEWTRHHELTVEYGRLKYVFMDMFSDGHSWPCYAIIPAPANDVQSRFNQLHYYFNGHVKRPASYVSPQIDTALDK